MLRTRTSPWVRWCAALGTVFAMIGCSEGRDDGPSGELGLQLVIGDRVFNDAQWTVQCNGETFDGTIDLSGVPDEPIVAQIGGLPPGNCTLSISATSKDGTTCQGSVDFPVQAGEVTHVAMELRCPGEAETGGVRVDGTINFCPALGALTAIPARVQVGFPIQVGGDAVDPEGDPIVAQWTATAGEFADPNQQNTTYTCTEAGAQQLTLTVHDGDPECADSQSVMVECLPVDVAPPPPPPDAAVPDAEPPPVDAEPPPPVDAEPPPPVDAEPPPPVDAEPPPPVDAEPPPDLPDPVTVTSLITCPTTIGIDVFVEGTLTMAPQAPFQTGLPTDVVVTVTAVQQAIPGITIDATVVEARWSASVIGGLPAVVAGTETFDPPINVNIGMDNIVNLAPITITTTPEPGATQLVYQLDSVGIDAAIAGAAVLPIECPVSPDAPTISFPVN
jgi:hypothetical protein